jgi:hypothetical protein
VLLFFPDTIAIVLAANDLTFGHYMIDFALFISMLFQTLVFSLMFSKAFFTVKNFPVR